MSAGLSLLKVLCRTQSRTLFREINPRQFTDEETPFYAFVSQHYRMHGVLPTLDVMTENHLALGAMIRDTEPATYYRQRVAERYVLFAVRDVLPEMQQALAVNGHGQLVEAINTLTAVVRIGMPNGGVIHLADAVDKIIEDYNEAKTHPGIQGITFGYPWLDEITGGAQDGDLITMAARTGMGKSYMLNQFSLAAWQAGYRVLMVSNEMTALQTAQRVVGAYTGINPERIKRGMLSHYAESQFMFEASAMKGGAPYVLIDGGFKLQINEVDALMQEFEPDICYVDAAYLMQPENIRHTMKGHEVQREMSKELKSIALRRRRPVIQTIQLNREAVKKHRDDIDLSMLAGSDGIAQDSTTVIISVEGEAPFEDETRDHIVAKNRSGRKSWMRTNFLFDPPNFDFVTSKEQAAAAGGQAAHNQALQTHNPDYAP